MEFFKIDQHYQIPEKGVEGWLTVGFYEAESGVEVCVLGVEPSEILVSMDECGYRRLVSGTLNGARAVPVTGDTRSLEAVVEEYLRSQGTRNVEPATASPSDTEALIKKTVDAVAGVSLASLQLTLALDYLSGTYGYQVVKDQGAAGLIFDKINPKPS
ncbi:hypothetical protein HYV83_00130 [Candidatus Woesearchaeota archaeon]|nr:hypothetical protein [Candidatus Woesearchaeota archaeon]